MNKICIFSLLVFINFPSYAFNQAKLMDAWVSVVMIRGYTDNGSLAYGSGVIVGENEVVTNCHVLRNTKKPWVSQGEYAFSITSVKADPWKDLCLLTVFNLNRTPVPIGNSMDLYKGQELAGIGHSNGAPVPLTTGGYVISAYDMNEGGRIILSSAKFRLGASGSGLFDMDGKLVGINTFKTTGYGSYYSVPAEWIHEVRKLPASNEFPIQGKALWEEDEDKKPYFLKIAIPKVKENWQELVMITKLWIEQEQNNTEAWFEYGYANEMLKNYSLALDAYKKSLSKDVNNSDALFRSGVVENLQGHKAEAKTIHNELERLNPARADELYELISMQ
ncbi:MAG: trypsin-like peptidase domain-containing protein [Methylophilaceae bacterium]